jgi:ribose transport system substrate-binding protein
MGEAAETRSVMRPISGLGPHGEFAASADQLHLSPAALGRAAAARYAVALVLHTKDSGWSRLQIAGIKATLERYGATLLDVVECGFRPERQTEVMDALLERTPDGIISIPLDRGEAARSHRRIVEAGIALVLMDNAPPGMVATKDYVGVVSADNFGNGEIAAEILAADVPHGGAVCVVGYGVDFPVTNERELGFRRWLREHRPDIAIERVEFEHPEQAGVITAERLARSTSLDGLFVVWDEPALLAADAVRSSGRSVPVTTVDLGLGVALEIASADAIIGLGAQRPYDQGVAEATAVIMALAGQEPPPWIALPALGVTRRNVLEAYEVVWHEAPPPELRRAYEEGAPED